MRDTISTHVALFIDVGLRHELALHVLRFGGVICGWRCRVDLHWFGLGNSLRWWRWCNQLGAGRLYDIYTPPAEMTTKFE